MTTTMVIESPSVNLVKLLKFIGIVSGVVGMNCTIPNYRFNKMTIMMSFALVICNLFILWRVFEMTQIHWMATLEAGSTVGTAFLVTTKLVNVFAHANDIYCLQMLLVQLYHEFENKGHIYKISLNRCNVRVKTFVIATGLLYFLLSFAMLSIPFVIWIVTGHRHLILPFYVPGLDITTSSGYFITLSFQSFLFFFGGFLHYVGDLFVIFYFVQTYCLFEIFRLKVKDFNDLTENLRLRNQCNMNKALIDIVLWHKLYLKYLTKCNKTFYIQILAQVFCCAFTALMCLYLMLVTNYLGAYTLLGYSLVSLYLYCILGTVSENCGEEFYNEVYNIFWYNLSVPQQKIVRLMLMQSQKQCQIKLVGVLPLSVDTALQVTKFLYSTYMIMLNLIKK